MVKRWKVGQQGTTPGREDGIEVVPAADYDVLAAALRFAREALDVARTGCACSVPERASGHHVDCYVPQVKEAIEAVDLALAHAGGGPT